jgi:dTMP kinase
MTAMLGAGKIRRPATVELVMMGIFLAIEGPKCVGKTAVVSSLRRQMAGHQASQVVLTKEPTPGFDLGQESHLLGTDLARAIAQDRAAHVASVILPALQTGRTVVCDRYILSTLAFHSADGVAPEEIWRLNASFPLPDVNLVLTASPGVLGSRRALRPSRTRLEADSDPAAELARYLEFGEEMRARGVELKIILNETPEQLAMAVWWIMHLMREGIPS